MSDETLKMHYIWHHSINENNYFDLHPIIIEKDVRNVKWNLKIVG